MSTKEIIASIGREDLLATLGFVVFAVVLVFGWVATP